MNLVKFLKTPFLQNTSGRLLLQDRKEKRLFLRKLGNSTKEHHIIPGKYVNLYQNTVSNFARLLGACSLDYNPEHVNIPRKKANILTEHLILPRLCTIQNASNFQAKIYLRTPFLQNSFRSGFCQISVSFLKREKTETVCYTSSVLDTLEIL